MFGLNYVIFRPHNVYGTRQNIADRYRNVIGIFMNQTLKGLPMTIFGDGSQRRAFSHISDVAPAIAESPLVGEANNQVFNIGADTAYTVNQLSEEVAAALGLPWKVVHLPARNEVADAVAEHEKVRKIFNLAESVSLKAGLSEMARWARTKGTFEPTRFSNIELSRNMPPSWL